jgi:hypothetical protein
MDNIQKSDHFLLTVILTIASRDLPEHAATHCRCWDHTQRLLSGVVLAHPWAQSPRTVQALLLLSEWLPHIQVKFTSSEANKSLFAEDRTAWSLVGLAVRQGYLLRLDQAAFCEVENEEFKEREEQKRIIWTCECACGALLSRANGTDLSGSQLSTLLIDRSLLAWGKLSGLEAHQCPRSPPQTTFLVLSPRLG